MSAREEWERLEPLLDRALELEGAELARFLDEVGRDDPRLRRRLEEYLGATEHGTLLVDLPLHSVAGGLVDRLELERLDANLAPGRSLGAYRIVEELGEGGMGRVYLAEREGSPGGEKVALKVLNRSHLERQEMQRRFERERQILGNLDHPGIARLLDVGITADGRPYFALEYVEGENLVQYCVSRNLSIEQRVRLFARVCEAVHYAHERGVVHRDLKPSNLLVAESAGGEPRVCVLDFGIAREEKTHEITLTGQIMGTPGYMSPEQARGRTALVDHRADVFSLGVILYELIGGRKPFDGKTPADVLLSLVDDDPLPLAGRDTAVPTALERIVLRCLAKEPADRYDGAAQLAADLERFLAGGAPLLGRSPGEWRWRDLVRRYGAAFAVGAAAVVALVALGLASWQQIRAERAVSRRAEELYARGEALAAEWTALQREPAVPDRHARLQTFAAAAAELGAPAAGGEAAVAAAAHQAAGVLWQALGEVEPARRYLELALPASDRPSVAAMALAAALRDGRALELALRQVESRAEGTAIDAGVATAPAELLAALATASEDVAFDAGRRRLAELERRVARGEGHEAAALARDLADDEVVGVEASMLAGDAELLRLGSDDGGDAVADGPPGDAAEALASAASSYRRAAELAPGDPRPVERSCVVAILRRATPSAAIGTAAGSAGAVAVDPCETAVADAPWRWQGHALLAVRRALDALALATPSRGAALLEAADAAAEAVAAAPRSALAHRARAAVELLAATVASGGTLPRIESAIGSLQTAIAALPQAAAAAMAPGDALLASFLWERLGRARLLAARLASGAPARSAAELAVEALRGGSGPGAAPTRWLALAEACALRAELELGRGPALRDWVEQTLAALEQAERSGADATAVALARAEVWVVAGRHDELSGVEPVDAGAASALARSLVERGVAVAAARRVLARAEVVRARYLLVAGQPAAAALEAARDALARAAGADEDVAARAELLAATLLAEPPGSDLRPLARAAAALASRPGAALSAQLLPARVELEMARRGLDPSRRLERAESVLQAVLAARPHEPEALLLLATVHLVRAATLRSASKASVELWRGIDPAERARLERPAWAEAELVLAELHGALAAHKSGAERREALRQQEVSARRARELNPLVGNAARR